MVIWCEKVNLKIETDIEPKVSVRIPLPSDDKETRKDKEAKPYLNKKRIMWSITYNDEQYCFVIPKGYTYDGASIPYGFRWIIGAKGSDEFMVASLAHDWMCENHDCVGNNRYLSTLIFKEILLACHVSKFKAETMFNAVDLFQKMFGKWEQVKCN